MTIVVIVVVVVEDFTIADTVSHVKVLDNELSDWEAVAGVERTSNGSPDHAYTSMAPPAS
ncbi:hypothetical protein EGR_11264 [Echinococcus granulosus]|uniref:Uncharacterized protein n=1 Tax=Echinococcus granulosus TaxID=6210 RepID=W6TYS6_ECHGR|nr:hypothetical protein EGR_11264 [Echinococcus granulosus]EUB53883.1 hypothetical protein EGR_11264 [Echinococcus granulosus]